MNPLVIIPARGGSKGIPGKNIKSLNGKPLIAYTIEAAKKIFPKDHIIISTDDDKIAECCTEHGLEPPFKRPSELSSDIASSRSVILHAMNYAEENGIDYNVVILLQPTSPFRTDKQIREALELYSIDLDMVVSVEESKSNPYYNLFEENPEGLLAKSKKGNYTRRQDAPVVYEFNGAIYIINPSSIKAKEFADFSRIKKYRMDAITSIDIDTELDWILAEATLKKKS